MKGYKMFDKDMKCQGFQYKEGEEYKEKEPIKICSRGFHFCTNPLDVLNYYDLTEGIFAEVEALGDTEKDKSLNADSKTVTSHIKIVKKLALKEFIEAAVKFFFTTIKSGYSSKVATSGDYSKVATSGDYSKVATSGYYSQVATSGSSSQVATSGYFSKAATSGDYSKVATSGDYSQVATSGSSSKVATSGYYSQVELRGENNVGANIGVNGIIKGIKGSWITLAEYNDKYECICVRSAKVDGNKIKANVFYKLENGKFQEVK